MFDHIFNCCSFDANDAEAPSEDDDDEVNGNDGEDDGDDDGEEEGKCSKIFKNKYELEFKQGIGGTLKYRICKEL